MPSSTSDASRGRTPLLLLDCPGEADGTILMYGHLDKQPEMVGWREGLGPWSPVREGDKLYGRGGADDGYALYCALAAMKAGRARGERSGPGWSCSSSSPKRAARRTSPPTWSPSPT